MGVHPGRGHCPQEGLQDCSPRLPRAIGEGLQAFCIPGSVADQRAVGLGHGNLGAMLLSENTKCFAFLAGHESFAAAEGAIGIARTANKVRKEPLRVILNGLGKDAAYIISRINGFTYVQTQMDYKTGEVKIVKETAYSDGEKAKVRCYGCDDVTEGVAIMRLEDVDVSITGNSTNPTRFQHPVAGTYKKWAVENGKKYFSVASGGGTGRTLHPDNMAAGPASYGMTDTMGRISAPMRSLPVPLRACACGNDGSHRHGQQPHGRRDRGCGCGHRGSQQVSFRMKKSPSTRTGSQLVEKSQPAAAFSAKTRFPCACGAAGETCKETLLRKASESTAHVAGFGIQLGGLRPSEPPGKFFDSLRARPRTGSFPFLQAQPPLVDQGLAVGHQRSAGHNQVVMAGGLDRAAQRDAGSDADVHRSFHALVLQHEAHERAARIHADPQLRDVEYVGVLSGKQVVIQHAGLLAARHGQDETIPDLAADRLPEYADAQIGDACIRHDLVHWPCLPAETRWPQS